MVKKQRQLNPYLLLILSFLGLVLLGSFLLSMPFAFRNNPNNEWCHGGTYMDAFFTSLSAMSNTGVTTYPAGLADTLSIPGQIIVLVLVQIGGLGIVTILTFLFTLFRRNLEFKNRLMISQAIAFNNFSEIVKFVRRLMIITVVCEVIGFGLGIPVYIKMFPDNVPKALYYSFFYSISAFNNAGFDLSSGTTSFIDGIHSTGGLMIETTNWLYYYSTIYLAVLSLLGGLSFLVIIEVVLGHKPPRRWSAFTKIVLAMTVGMILLFSLLLFLFEGFKPENPMNYYESLMQIINCRTAGFTFYSQEDISLPGRMLCCIMMFVGGAPLSTAGGRSLDDRRLHRIDILELGRRALDFDIRFRRKRLHESGGINLTIYRNHKALRGHVTDEFALTIAIRPFLVHFDAVLFHVGLRNFKRFHIFENHGTAFCQALGNRFLVLAANFKAKAHFELVSSEFLGFRCRDFDARDLDCRCTVGVNDRNCRTIVLDGTDEENNANNQRYQVDNIQHF